MAKVTRLDPKKKRHVPEPATKPRPMPPDAAESRFTAAPDVLEWLRTQIIEPQGLLHNPDHLHLQNADLAVLWAPTGFRKQGRRVIGQAEKVMFRCSPWHKARQEQQMADWFDRTPEYLITLDASFASSCSDADWCALIEHELYHVAHALDPFGAPAFSRDTGLPKLEIRGHDVEEFVGVVRRYGAGGEHTAIGQMLQAAGKDPEVAKANISAACGTCMSRAA